jgi:hypothetical protein
MSSHYSGEPEPTVPYDRGSVPPTDDGYLSPYGEPHGYPAEHGYRPGYPEVQRYGQLEPAPPYGYPDPRLQAYGYPVYPPQKSRVAAGLLALFLGCFGIHNFYLGRTGIGVCQLLLTVLSVFILSPLVAVWVLIEAIMIFSGSPSFRTDARGVPLRD